MHKVKVFGFGFGLLTLFLLSLFLLIGLFKPKMAGLNISTTPSAKVFVNNQEVGITPYKDFYRPGKYVIRLIPETFGQDVETYDSEINLSRGVETVIRRDFGLTNDLSSGYLITFERNSSNKASISVISDPDFSEVALDQKSRAIAPYKTSEILPGEHEISVRREGYLQNTFKVNTYKGYQLLAIVKLARVIDSGQAKNSGEKETLIPETSLTPSVSPTPIQAKDKGMGFVEVVNTPTGFLRIRSEPSTLGTEVGQAKPGEKYVLIGVDQKTGWYKIEFEVTMNGSVTKSGWVSNLYTKKVAK